MPMRCFVARCRRQRPQPEYLAFHGDAGTLFMSGTHGEEDQIWRCMPGQLEWEEVPIATQLLASLSRA